MGLKGASIKNRFRSRSEHNLDGKGRLNFPSRFREVLNYYDSEVLMIAPWGRTHLRAYPLPEWETLETTLMTQGNRQKNMGRFIRYIVGSVAECTLDKQGRVLIPPQLRAEANLDRELVLVGMLNHVEIWDKPTWESENLSTSENFEDFSDQLAELGIF